jgi:hypothetical protein
MVRMGDTYLLPKPGHSTPHLWIVLTEPDATSGDVIMVNLTTQRSYSDATVVLNAGDHPFVQHATVVNYSDARYARAAALDTAAKSGICRLMKPMSEDVLKRIQEGLLNSPHTPNKIKSAFRGALDV